MKWPLVATAVPRSEIPLHNLYYLHGSGARAADPTILWGTDVDMEGMRELLAERRRLEGALISSSHVLLQATAQALAMHPWMNRRVVGHRIFAFRNLNLRMACQNRREGGVDVLLLTRADELTLRDIAEAAWEHLLQSLHGGAAIQRDNRRMKSLPGWAFQAVLALYGWFDRRWPLPSLGRLDRLRSSAVLVNDLSFRDAPPMRCYKPTRFPDESVTVNVTLGPMEEKAVACEGRLATRMVAPLFVQADHRIVDAYQVGRFVGTLRDYLQQPDQLDSLAGARRMSRSGVTFPSGEVSREAPARRIA